MFQEYRNRCHWSSSFQENQFLFQNTKPFMLDSGPKPSIEGYVRTYIRHGKLLFSVPCPPTRTLPVRAQRTAKRDDTKSLQVEETHHPELLSLKWPSFGQYSSADLLVFFNFTRKRALSSFGRRRFAPDGSGGATIAAPRREPGRAQVRSLSLKCPPLGRYKAPDARIFFKNKRKRTPRSFGRRRFAR